MDAVLARHPQVVLVDELAHTNTPGSKNPKRWQDIEELLDAGITVLSTVNVQHLESLNDVVAQITGIEQQETVPDDVVRAAAQIELVDITPEALRRRLSHGNVYAPERIDAALNNFFKIENLTALRETALRQVAEQVEAKRITTSEPVGSREDDAGEEAAAAVGERLLALVEPQPSSQRLIRRAWRSAQRLGADLDVLWVKPPGTPTEEQERALTALRQLCSVLGANFMVVEGDDVVQTAAEVVR